LAGGERKPLALGYVLAMAPDLLILDEPSVGLDPRRKEHLMTILETFNKTLLIVSGVRTLGEMEKVFSESRADFYP
jgi:energy-coupling factor transporter ATP-binding protein EcfA2